jgi:hypothetical protein
MTTTGFKGFYWNEASQTLLCRGVPYALGRTTTHIGEVVPGSSGLHFAGGLGEAFSNYTPHCYGNRFALVQGTHFVHSWQQSMAKLPTYACSALTPLHWLEGKYEYIPTHSSEGAHAVCYMHEGRLHREDGPAYEVYNREYTEIMYFQHGRRHRLDGPATVYGDGACSYFIDGEWCDSREYVDTVNRRYPRRSARLAAKGTKPV